jgi:hypothetical protein
MGKRDESRNIDYEKPSNGLAIRDYKLTFKPTEKKVLLSLTSLESATFYLLTRGSIKRKVDSIGSGGAVLSALKSLHASGLIDIQQEKTGLRRKWYSLTTLGLIYALSFDEFWRDLSNLRRVVEIHYDKIPILLSKFNIFEGTEWSKYYVDQLKRWTPWVLMETYYNKSIIDRVENKEVFTKYIAESLKGLPDNLKEAISKYPRYREELYTLIQDPSFRLTARVLGIIDIVNTQNILLSPELKRLSRLKNNKEIMKFIEDGLKNTSEEYELKLKRLKWWMNAIEIIKRGRTNDL